MKSDQASSRTKMEQFTRQIAEHLTLCGDQFDETERVIRPFEDVTVALTCRACGETFRERFTEADLLAHGREELEKLFEQIQRRSIN